jgi:hypothetical protein
MNISKILYWFVFVCICLYSFYLQYKGYETLGIKIMLFLSFFHIIVFHLAENSFIEIRYKIREDIGLITKGIIIVTIAILTFVIIVIMAILFLLKKLFLQPREFFKALQQL